MSFGPSNRHVAAHISSALNPLILNK